MELSGEGRCFMTGILLVVAIIIGILFFAGLFFRDDSLIILAQKVFIGLFLLSVVIGLIVLIICVPWLLIVGLIVSVIGYIFYKNDKKQNDIFEKQNDVNNENLLSLTNEQELSDFQKELQENTKTPKQVEDENWLKEKEHVIKNAQGDYKYIKDQLVEKAKNGDYINLDQQKQIIYNFECSFLLSCINRRYSSNPSGRIGTSSYKPNEKVDYYINNSKQYYLYLNTIKELAQTDNISIKEIFISKKDSADNGTYVNIPYTYTNTILVRFHQIKVILECLIRY